MDDTDAERYEIRIMGDTVATAEHLDDARRLFEIHGGNHANADDEIYDDAEGRSVQ